LQRTEYVDTSGLPWSVSSATSLGQVTPIGRKCSTRQAATQA